MPLKASGRGRAVGNDLAHQNIGKWQHVLHGYDTGVSDREKNITKWSFLTIYRASLLGFVLPVCPLAQGKAGRHGCTTNMACSGTKKRIVWYRRTSDRHRDREGGREDRGRHGAGGRHRDEPAARDGKEGEGPRGRGSVRGRGAMSCSDARPANPALATTEVQTVHRFQTLEEGYSKLQPALQAPGTEQGAAAEAKPKAAGPAGGVYMPPFKLAQLMAAQSDKASPEYQRLTWDALRKSINGLVNKVNGSNIKEIVGELIKEVLLNYVPCGSP